MKPLAPLILSLTAALCGALTVPLNAQTGTHYASKILKQGQTLTDILPAGWTISGEARGDLNKDGIADCAFVLQPNDPANIIPQAFLPECPLNTNPNILCIYYGTKEGLLEQFAVYEGLIPADEEFIPNQFSKIEISPKGVLNITRAIEPSAGSYSTGRTTYRFRFQDNNFYLIGKEAYNLARNTGVSTVESSNYLTHKKATTYSNEFNEAYKPHTEWSKIPKAPLRTIAQAFEE